MLLIRRRKCFYKGSCAQFNKSVLFVNFYCLLGQLKDDRGNSDLIILVRTWMEQKNNKILILIS